jgi:sterol desaturase/sphingolipid hydroxylase (fatty acid hydroxylase superfamily)
VVPTIWLPIAAYIGLRSLLQFGGIPLASFKADPYLPLGLVSSLPTEAYLKTTLCFFFGNFIWTLLEYGFHRFLFHVDFYLPDHPKFLMIHFLVHGIHHYMPMDKCVCGRPVEVPSPDIFLIQVATRYAACLILRALFPDDSTGACPLPDCYS